MSLAEEIDTFALTKERAVVAKALALQRPGVSPRVYLDDAAAILLALDEHYNAREWKAETPAADDSALFGLSVEQEIRARSAAAAAVLLAPIFATNPNDVLRSGGPAPLWLLVAEAGAEFINTGEFPDDDDEDEAEDFCAGCGGPCRDESDDEDIETPALTDTTLWAVHVKGPDDLLPMVDRTAADALAAEVNAIARTLQSRADASELDPHFSAEVVEWDGTAEEHATHLAAFIADGSVYLP